MGLPINWIDI